MKKLFVSTIVSVAICLITGCVTVGTNDVVQLGPDLYMIGGPGGFTDFSGSVVKTRLYQTASKFCRDKGCVMLSVKSTSRDSGLGTYATAEIQFLCLKPNDPRLASQNSVEVPPAPAVGAQTRPQSSGTGFFITDDGYFITNQHVASEGATVQLLTAVGLIAARVVKADKANDLSLLKAEGKFVALPVIASRGVRLGATVFTVGFPNTGLQGFSPKLAKGDIASLAGVRDDARHFQISAPIQPGNSGGALVDERGNVVGVVVASLNQKAALATSGVLAQNVNYAVKSSYVLSFLESVPEVADKLKEQIDQARKFEDVVKAVEKATVLVLVY